MAPWGDGYWRPYPLLGHSLIYSPAAAAHLYLPCCCRPQVDPEERLRRRDELTSVQQQITAAHARSLLGREIMVLVDGQNEDGELLG